LETPAGTSAWHLLADKFNFCEIAVMSDHIPEFISPDIDDVRERLREVRDIEAILEMVRSTGRQICKSDGITFAFKKDDLCYCAEEDAIEPLWKGQSFPLDITVSGWSMRSGEIAVIEDVSIDPRISREVYARKFIKSLIMVPVGGRNFAAMGAYWKDKRLFTAMEITTVKIFSTVVGAALKDLLDR
jgi:putative two-component system response regulator